MFADGRSFIPELLPKYTLAYALTIQKSQGSEYQHVTIVLPEHITVDSNDILSQELLYTAVTRARSSLALYCSELTLCQALATTNQRLSGLAVLSVS